MCAQTPPALNLPEKSPWGWVARRPPGQASSAPWKIMGLQAVSQSLTALGDDLAVLGSGLCRVVTGTTRTELADELQESPDTLPAVPNRGSF